MSDAAPDDARAVVALGSLGDSVGYGRCPRCDLGDMILYGADRVCWECRGALVAVRLCNGLHRGLWP